MLCSYATGKRVQQGRRGSTRIAVITITDEEFTAATARFGAAHNLPGTPYFIAAALDPGDYDVVVRQSPDRGNQPAAQVVRDFIEDFWPGYFLVVGTAGGVDNRDGIALGDVVIADYVDYVEFKKILPDGNRARKIPYDHPSLYLRESFAAPLAKGDNWIAEIQVERPADGHPKALIGNILSGEKIWGNPDDEEQKAMLRIYDKALAVETEAYGVARELFHARGRPSYNPQYAVIRGISDIVDAPNNNETRHLWTPYAAAVAAAYAFCIARTLLTMPD